MLTNTEIEKFSKILDNEYENEILPILKTSQEAIDSILKLVYSSEHREVLKRTGYPLFRTGNVTPEILKVISRFRYTEDGFEHTIRHDGNPPRNISSFLGYSYTSVFANSSLFDLFSKCENYRGNPSKIVNEIASLKKRFNEIKDAYNKFFIENNGKMFDNFSLLVSSNYNFIMFEDKKMDDEIYSLFGADDKVRGIKITITIEDLKP